MYRDLLQSRSRVPKEVVVSQIFTQSGQHHSTIYRPVSRLPGHHSLAWDIVQGCWERPWKASLRVSVIGPGCWTDKQESAVVVCTRRSSTWYPRMTATDTVKHERSTGRCDFALWRGTIFLPDS